MLKTVREYALEQLEAAGEVQELNLRNARWYLEKVAAIEPDSQAEAAMAWSSRRSTTCVPRSLPSKPLGDVDSTLRLASTMWRVWRGSQRRERQAILERLLASGGGSTGSRAWATDSLATSLRASGEIDHARDSYEQPIALADEAGDNELAAWALSGIAGVARMQGRYQEAFDYAEQARARARAAGKPGLDAMADRAEGRAAARPATTPAHGRPTNANCGYRQSTGEQAGLAEAMGNLGVLCTLEDDPETGVWYLTQALEGFRADSSPNPNESIALFSLGQAASRWPTWLRVTLDRELVAFKKGVAQFLWSATGSCNPRSNYWPYPLQVAQRPRRARRLAS